MARIVCALRRLVEDGWELTEDIFVELLARALTQEDHKAAAVQRMLQLLRKNVLKMGTVKYHQLLQVHNLYIPPGLVTEVEKQKRIADRTAMRNRAHVAFRVAGGVARWKKRTVEAISMQALARERDRAAEEAERTKRGRRRRRSSITTFGARERVPGGDNDLNSAVRHSVNSPLESVRLSDRRMTMQRSFHVSSRNLRLSANADDEEKAEAIAQAVARPARKGSTAAEMASLDKLANVKVTDGDDSDDQQARSTAAKKRTKRALAEA